MKELINKKFSQLTVINFVGKFGKNYKWECLCDCGNKTFAWANKLNAGTKKSCGCLNIEKRFKKGVNQPRLKARIFPSQAYEYPYEKRRIMYLSDSYLRKEIKNQIGIPIKEITAEMVELKREQLTIHRLLKRGLKNGVTNTGN